MKSRLLRFLPVLPLVALFLVTGFRGLDFGEHWDEIGWQINPVQEMVRTGRFMPPAAMYPAFARWLVLFPAALRGLAKLVTSGIEPRPIQAAMLAVIDAPQYLLTARAVFLVVSSLTIVWTYLAALVLGRRTWEALVAAAVLGLSWEFAYHSRFVATDCIDVQFSGLTLLFTCCFVRFKRLHWLWAAAIAAGLGIGTKFSAGPLLFPVLVVGAWALPLWRVGAQLKRAAASGALAFAAFAISTPAVFFDPFSFVEQLRFISTYYARGHYGHGVEPGLEHWWKVLLYFAMSYFSPFRALCVAALALVLLGGYFWWRADRRMAVVLIGFPLVFLAAVCNRFAVVLVRNYLMIAPFCGLLLARAVTEVYERLPWPWAKRSWALVLAAAGAANAVFLVQAGESIHSRDVVGDLKRALRVIASRPSERVQLSGSLASLAKQHHLALAPNVTDQKPDHVLLWVRADGPDPVHYPANDPFAFEDVFGPREVNVAWYPTWSGADHIALMTIEKARSIGVPFVLRRRR